MSDSLHPDIPLHVVGPQFQALNPIETMGHLAVMQNQLNQARLFQQTFAAKMGLGAIIAGSPDLDSAFQNITKSGLIGYAPEVATMLKGLQATDVTIAGERLKQAGSAIDMAGHLSAIAFNDPSKLAQVRQIANAALPANAPANVKAALNNYMDAITPDSSLPPVAQKNQAQTSIAGAMVGANMPTSVTEGVTGPLIRAENVLNPLTGQVGPAFGRQLPAVLGGQAQLGLPVPTGLAPTTVEAPGGGHQVFGGGYGTGLAAPSGASPSTSLGVAPIAPPEAAPAGPLAGDGKPLVDLSALPKVPLQGVMGGMAPANAAIAGQNTALQKEYGENGQRELNAARQTQGSVSEIKAAFNNLMRDSIDPKTGQPKSNFLDVGAGGQFRADMANMLNTTAGIIGMQPLVDPGKVASAQDLMKATNRLGVQYTVQSLGNQREAAYTIERLTSGAQPNIGNTYLGGMLVANMVNAGALRTSDWRNYQAAVMAHNNGFIDNQAATTFDRQHPYNAYVSQAFDAYKSDVANAFKSNYISRDEAASALRVIMTAQHEMAGGR